MRRHALAIAAAIGLALAATGARAAELLMLEKAGCPWCARWHAEIGDAYPRTGEGRRAPLRRSDIDAPLPPGVELARRATFTPTFVLLHEGREVGRIEGHPGAEFFWPMLGLLLDRLPPDMEPGAGAVQ